MAAESLHVATDTLPWRDSPYPGDRPRSKEGCLLFVLLPRPIEELDSA